MNEKEIDWNDISKQLEQALKKKLQEKLLEYLNSDNISSNKEEKENSQPQSSVKNNTQPISQTEATTPTNIPQLPSLPIQNLKQHLANLIEDQLKKDTERPETEASPKNTIRKYAPATMRKNRRRRRRNDLF